MVRIVSILGKYDQRRLWKWICVVNPFDILFLKPNLSLDNKNLKWGDTSLHIAIAQYTLATINNTLLFSTFWNLYLPV